MSAAFLGEEDDLALIGAENLDAISAAYSDRYPEAAFFIDLVVVTPDRIRELNAEHRGIDEATDVLSFPTFATGAEALATAIKGETLVGGIAICPEKVLAYGETLPQMVHHGLLHLLGFDHETDMVAWRREEESILESLASRGLIIPPVPNDAV